MKTLINMEARDIKIGDRVRWKNDGKVYEVTKIYDEEVSAGCHSFYLDKVDLEDDNGNLHSAYVLDIVEENVQKDDLRKHIATYQLSEAIRKLCDEYKKSTNDSITKIICESPYKITIIGNRLGEYKIC